MDHKLYSYPMYKQWIIIDINILLESLKLIFITNSIPGCIYLCKSLYVYMLLAGIYRTLFIYYIKITKWSGVWIWLALQIELLYFMVARIIMFCLFTYLFSSELLDEQYSWLCPLISVPVSRKLLRNVLGTDINWFLGIFLSRYPEALCYFFY